LDRAEEKYVHAGGKKYGGKYGMTADQTHRVLVVDDNEDAVRSLAILLELSGYEVRLAKDGYEALDVAQQFNPHAVVLDIGLPGMNGYETARKLRERTGNSMLLVALSGYGQDRDRERSREAGFDHHLLKPVDVDALQQVLSEKKPQ
jgi:CheY-like chemotaxis protein